MTTATATVQSLGPGELKGSDPTIGYALAKDEWYAIQRWMDVVRSLPADDTALRQYVGMTAGDDSSDFQPLLPAFGRLRDHETTWSATVYPATVTTASDVVAYAQKVPIYYKPLTDLAQKLAGKPSIQPGDPDVQHFTEILDRLSKLADGYATNVGLVATQVDTLATGVRADQTEIANLITTYKTDHDLSQDEIDNLQAEEDDLKRALEKAHKEYEHDVIVASTTPTYGWVPYVGPVAAGTVAGIYGKKAEAARKKIERLQAQIKALKHEISVDKHILSLFSQATDSLTYLDSTLGTALQALQHVQGVWGAMRDDMQNLIKTINEEIRSNENDYFFKQFGIEDAVAEWKAVGERADAWRVHAFIDTTANAAA